MFENDPTEEPFDQSKVKKLTMKELQERVASLEVQLELARPEHVARMQESHKQAQLRIRDLGYYLREKDYSIGRLERRVKALEQNLPPTTDRVKDMEDQLLLARKELAGAQRRQESLEHMLPLYETFRAIVQEHAIQMWFKCLGETIPLERDGVTYHIIGGNMEIRAAVPRVGEGATLRLNDEEIASFQRYAYGKLLERYGDQQPAPNEEQRTASPSSSSETALLCAIVQEHAIALYLNAREGTTIPLQRDGATHFISFGNTQTRIFTEIVRPGEEYNTYLLTDKEYASFTRISYNKLLELSGNQQPTADEEQSHLCHCGCRREVPAQNTGRPGEYFSASCRKRAQRSRERAMQLELLPDVTKQGESVTKG